MKKLILIIVVVSITSVLFAQKLSLTKTTFKPGESIEVNFNALSSYAKDAWVGIIPSNISHGSETVNDQNDLAYQYLNGRTSGNLVFIAPNTEGKYDFRMHDTDNNGKEVTYISFVVSNNVEPNNESYLKASMHLEKLSYSPGEKISLYYNAPPFSETDAWIGILPINIPHGNEAENDNHELTYQYIGTKSSGTLTFTAPSIPGNYSFRMHDTDKNGKEISNISFTVK